MDYSSLPPYSGFGDRTPDRGEDAWVCGSLELGLLGVALFVAVAAAFVVAGVLLLGGGAGPAG